MKKLEWEEMNEEEKLNFLKPLMRKQNKLIPSLLSQQLLHNPNPSSSVDIINTMYESEVSNITNTDMVPSQKQFIYEMGEESFNTLPEPVIHQIFTLVPYNRYSLSTVCRGFAILLQSLSITHVINRNNDLDINDIKFGDIKHYVIDSKWSTVSNEQFHPNMEEKLEYLKVNASQIEINRKFKNVLILSLWSSRYDAHNFLRYFNDNKLKKLVLSCRIGHDLFSYLKGAHNLLYLEVNICGIDECDIDEFPIYTPSLHTLSLHFNDEYEQWSKVKKYGKYLLNNTNPKQLTLKGNIGSIIAFIDHTIINNKQYKQLNIPFSVNLLNYIPNKKDKETFCLVIDTEFVHDDRTQIKVKFEELIKTIKTTKNGVIYNILSGKFKKIIIQNKKYNVKYTFYDVSMVFDSNGNRQIDDGVRQNNVCKHQGCSNWYWVAEDLEIHIPSHSDSIDGQFRLCLKCGIKIKGIYNFRNHMTVCI